MTVSLLIQQYELPTLLTYTIVGGWVRLERQKEEYLRFSIDSSSSTEAGYRYIRSGVFHPFIPATKKEKRILAADVFPKPSVAR